jgi:hypothetical protein
MAGISSQHHKDSPGPPLPMSLKNKMLLCFKLYHIYGGTVCLLSVNFSPEARSEHWVLNLDKVREECWYKGCHKECLKFRIVVIEVFLGDVADCT